MPGDVLSGTGMQLETLFIPLACGGGLFFGLAVFAYIYRRTRESIHLAMALLALCAAGLVFGEGIFLYYAALAPDLSLARAFHRIEQLAGLGFLAAFPFFLGRYLRLEGAAAKANRGVVLFGAAAMLGIGIAAFAVPDLYVSQSLADPRWIGDAALVGRGRLGLLYAVRDLLIGLLFAYALVHLLVRLVRTKELGELLPMLAGLLVAMYSALDDIVYVHARMRLDPLGGFEFTRFALGISVFIGLSMVVLIKRYIDEARQRARALAALKRSRRELIFLAYHDRVTGLRNRKSFTEKLDELMAGCERSTGERSLGVFVVHCAGLKDQADRLGIAVGEWLMNEIADRLKRCKRKSDFLFRVDMEEYALILTSVKQDLDYAIVAEKLTAELRKPYLSGTHTLYVAPRVGIASYPADDDRDAESLLRNAGSALAEARALGSDYQFFTQTIHRKAMERMELIHALRWALENQQFELHYQPQVNEAGRIVGAEALIRWTHPDRGPIPPSQFIPLAEETGLIIPLGRWVMNRACAQAKDWHALGVDVPVSVNLSTEQLKDKNLFAQVENSLGEGKLAADKLHIEITESCLMKDLDRNVAVLRSLEGLGCSFSIDDFGTGYSSLSYLKQLPVRTIKIDRSFVVDLPEDEQDCALVRAIAAMAKGMGMRVVAEGVETEEQATFLRSIGCDVIQGYLYSRPLSYNAFVAYAKKNSA